MGSLQDTRVIFDPCHAGIPAGAVWWLGIFGVCSWQKGHVVIIRGDIRKRKDLAKIIEMHIKPFATLIVPPGYRA